MKRTSGYDYVSEIHFEKNCGFSEIKQHFKIYRAQYLTM